ncbi:MAG: ATP-binding cassette domain-containing protein [bacterium]|nr:ATP-binding cassette domain-containing protein [bacterium]
MNCNGLEIGNSILEISNQKRIAEAPRICSRFEVKNVSKRYRSYPVLKHLNLDIYDKTITAVVGPNGCGKTTLAKILIGLESHDSGDIFYKGKNLNSIKMKDFRLKNQLMLQNPLLSVNPHFKIRKILAEPLIINWNLKQKEDTAPPPKKNSAPSTNKKKAGFFDFSKQKKGGFYNPFGNRHKNEINKKVEELIEIMELSRSFLERYPSQLSGGELQRVTLARTLIMEPEFVILDEPFAFLNDNTAARLMNYFKKVFQQMEVGVLFICHNFERVEFFADVVAEMQKGRIIRQVTKTDFFRGRAKD